ncbi:GNAT family N-acetyltransferase [Nonomuraea sp. NPDC049309]|uniref:GNAT family N-acetyltransferase n=1 Tax=Nonomuraea sp. NPDC049309 TaxID=3364350 RepID=UPI00371428C8
MDDDPIKGHEARVRAVDPLVADQGALVVREHDVPLEVPGGVGLVNVDRLDPGGLQAAWSPLVVHRLRARVSGPDPEKALGALLDRWLDMPRGDEPEQALSVVWPSRDTVPVRALAVRGFAPTVAVSVHRLRPHDAPAPPASPVKIRAAGHGDVDAVSALYERLAAFDAQFGWVTPRPSTPVRIRESVAGEVLPLEWCWLAEVDGEPVGCVIVEPPVRARWIAGWVNDAPVAYLGVMYVEPSARGRGIGAALAEVAHAHAAAEGVSSMLLHHALPNPLSTPFWARRGYRPLLTQWVRHLT